MTLIDYILFALIMALFLLPVAVALRMALQARTLLKEDDEKVPLVNLRADLLHWAPYAQGLPVCGASIRERWTIVYETVTCPACRKAGEMLQLQYHANTR